MSRAWDVPNLDPDAPVTGNARRILAVRTAELFSFDDTIGDAETSADLHNARIAAKRLRYTLEIFADLFGEDGRRAIAETKQLQDELGQIHDRDVRIDLIEDELATLPENATGKDAEARRGLLHYRDRERHQRAIEHAAVLQRWRDLWHGDYQATLDRLAASEAT